MGTAPAAPSPKIPGPDKLEASQRSVDFLNAPSMPLPSACLAKTVPSPGHAFGGYAFALSAPTPPPPRWLIPVSHVSVETTAPQKGLGREDPVSSTWLCLVLGCLHHLGMHRKRPAAPTTRSKQRMPCLASARTAQSSAGQCPGTHRLAWHGLDGHTRWRHHLRMQQRSGSEAL